MGEGAADRAGAATRPRPRRAGREPPIPVDLFVRVFADYERAKARAGRIDFDDLLVETVDLLETDAEAAATVRARKRWFSVDEYQDTNPLQQRLLELWLGDRADLCVVGDEDQTIYTFTGATSTYLTDVRRAPPGRPGRRADRELPLDAPGPRSSRTGCSPPTGRSKRADGDPRRRARSPTIAQLRRRPRPSWPRSSREIRELLAERRSRRRRSRSSSG